MSNPHHATFADVVKHLLLTEVLATERPDRYAETHAGAGVYRLEDDPERRFGIRHWVAADRQGSRHRDVVLPYVTATPATYPGSATLAMTVCPDADLLLCETDADSAADLRATADRLGHRRCEVVTTDGNATVLARLPDWPPGARTLVHVDPFDPWAGRPSALDVAGEVAATGHGLVLWYGFDAPDDRAWALPELDRPDLFAVDLLVTTLEGTVDDDGDLGDATTPGTGCGVVLAGVSPGTARRVERLAHAVAAAYRGARLPDGRAGAVDVLVDVS